MIQVATYSGKNSKYNNIGIEQYSLHDIRSLDEYDISVIDLDASQFWRNKERGYDKIDEMCDFQSVSEMINNSKTGKIVILLPQNNRYEYEYFGREYHRSTELKDMLGNLSRDILSSLYGPLRHEFLSYENTKSKINGREYDATFYFKNEVECKLKSERSHKATVVQRGKVIVSTLKIESGESLLHYLDGIGLLEKKEEIPDWMKDIQMFDDASQEERITNCEKRIEELQKEIDDSQNVLDKNMYLKSALYTNGEELVQVIFDILQEMLGCNLSEFEDKKKEDFLFSTGGTVFIGEIKGVNHNVKNQNISQLDNHYQGYLDEHEEANRDKVKAILVINHQKSKPIIEREPIKDTQISLAKRNNSLIIETYTLLKLLEKYRAGQVSREEVITMLKDNVGLLSV